jgi:hypothetical protein
MVMSVMPQHPPKKPRFDAIAPRISRGGARLAMVPVPGTSTGPPGSNYEGTAAPQSESLCAKDGGPTLGVGQLRSRDQPAWR